MANINTIFETSTKRAEAHPKRITKWIHYTKLQDNEGQYCNEKDKEEIEALADMIEADGEVLQDLLVRKVDTDEYEIIGGHKRCRACRLLVEERGKEEFAFLPCYINNVSDIRARFRLFSSNSHHEKTDYEKMYELTEMKKLLEEHPEEFPEAGSGRMVERLARLMGYNSTSTVGEYLTISQNLGDAAMQSFQSGELKKSAAVELSSLPETKQNELIEQGVTKHSDIKKVKQKEKSIQTKELPEPGAREREYLDKADVVALERAKEAEDNQENVVQEKQTFPVLKNNDERKEWLNNYQSFGVWYEDEHIGCTYYKYDFDNGARLVVETYKVQKTKWTEEHEQYYFHLIGGPEPPYGSYGVKKWTKHNRYCKHDNSETELIEFLKYIQRNNREGDKQ